MGRKKIDPNTRIGTTKLNRFGNEMIVIKYSDSNDILVNFTKSNEVVHTTWQCFRKGSVKSLYDKTIHGTGYIGVGNYKVTIDGAYTPQYISWNRMIQRCYDKKHLQRCPTYKNCTVCDEWHNFQNYAAWYDDNFYTVEEEMMCLDKDILCKEDKIYSPETCVFVPRSINMLFVKCDAKRGSLPIGVSYSDINKKYIAKCGNDKQGYIGRYDNPNEAFVAYKTRKEELIRSIANNYKGKIPEKLYYAMMKYSVKIHD